MTALRIRFTGVPANDNALVHRIRNFADDLQRSHWVAAIGVVETWIAPSPRSACT
jgi:hypothetical protein